MAPTLVARAKPTIGIGTRFGPTPAKASITTGLTKVSIIEVALPVEVKVNGL